MRFALPIVLAILLAGVGWGQTPEGQLPKGLTGSPLNTDFETGDLRDWLVTGAAFKGQPIKGDTVKPRRSDMISNHQGKYWVGGYEKLKDLPTGTLTSAPFKITHPFAAFLVGGGPYATQTCVELVDQQSQKILFRAAGTETETMRRVVVDLNKYQGKIAFIRVVDSHAGHWGHVNFDDFRFYSERPKFADAPQPKRVVDLFDHQGLSAVEAAKAMTVPKGFSVNVVASEPDLRQPIAMTIDERGRIWVAEAYSYPGKVPADKAKDRILIFEDSNGDGKFDKRTVFYDKLNLVSGLEVGFGGVWVGQAPELLFIPDKNQDDRPDGPPQVILDGWGYQDTHETLNSFIWGPDGWLYGCHGVFTHSFVGKPGTPKNERTKINAGIWRYHPTKDKFEVFAYGTSNPWGVDFNDHGQCALTCCVIPHLFHIIQGARYHRQAGSHFQPYTYADIPTIAKHRHWVGNQWNDADRAKSDNSGGGHAHAGAMFYLGGSWPEKYRNQLFMNNIHGARLNVDSFSRKGSGYVGDGEPDFCKTNDLWSQILYLRYGPDGQVYMIDWYDRNQCHHGRNDGHDRSNGRLFKISYDNAKPVSVDLRQKSDAELVALQLHPNDWYVRQARRLLQERAVTAKIDAHAIEQLKKMAFQHEDVTRKLRAFWALHVIRALNDNLLLQAMRDPNEYMRGWAIQFACENGTPNADIVKTMAELSKSDPSPVVRLYLASAVQRINNNAKWPIVSGLLQHEQDNGDHNLPLMYWYAAEPLAEVDMAKAYQLATQSKIPLVFQFMTRRIAAEKSGDALALLLEKVQTIDNPETQTVILAEIQQGLKGQRTVAMPKNWSKVFDKLGESKNDDLRARVWSLAVKFGDPTVRERMLASLQKSDTPLAQKREFLQTLLAARDAKVVPALQNMLSDPKLRKDALNGLAAFDDATTPAQIVKHYQSFSADEKRAALATLVSRAKYADDLLSAIAANKVARQDLTADLIRQLQNLRNEEINQRITKVWGQVRQTPEEKQKKIVYYKKLISNQPLDEKLQSHGRALFAKTCQQCHTLFGIGGKVGPDLTGSNRKDLDYLLSNVIDPSAVLGKDYIASVIETTRGRVITGIIKEKTKDAYVVVTAEETLTLPKDEVDNVFASDKSMMPDDLLKEMSDADVRALAIYLASSKQVPLAATKENANTLFNGKDLTGWTGDSHYWRVENGEIVARRGKENVNRNEFLVSDLLVRDFRLTLKVKLTPDSGNSGVQFRSEPLPGGDVRGYQADIGAGWWGKLYEEHGRGLLWSKPGDQHVKKGEWNEYMVEAKGNHIRTYINGKLCVDYTDEVGRREGILALQLHSGPPFEVRFKDLRLEVLE